MNLDSQPPTSSSIHQVRLTNGATLLIKRDTSVPVVSLNFWVEAGSIDEAPEERGMAHLIEHMIFKGTQKRGVGEISRDVEAAGGYLNAFTSFEHTCFYVVLPSDRIFEALDIEFDAFLNSTFDAGELAKEKEVVFEEMKMRRDDPWSWSWELLFQSLFKKTPYHWSVIGDEAVLRSVPRENLRDYYRKHYVPERTVICVVGNVDIWATEKWVRDHFESVTAPVPPPRRVLQDEEPSALQYLDEPGDIQQYYVSLGFPTVPIDHPDAAALEVLDAVLSDGGASRLSLAIREGSRSADEVGADHFAGKYGGAFVFQAVTDRRRVERLLDEVMEQVARLHQQDVSSRELERIKTRVKASKIYEKQSVDGQAKSLGYWQLQGDHGLEEKFLAALDAVAASDLRRVSRQYLQPRRATLLFYRPRNEKAFGAQVDWQARLEKALARAVIATDAREKRPRGLQRFKLSHGATLLIQERHAIPLVSVGIYFKGGFRDENPSQAGLTALMAKSLMKGTRQKSYAEYSQAVEGLAAHVDSVLEKDYWGLVGESLRDKFQETFSLMTEVLFTPAFSKGEIEKERQMQLAALRRLKDDPSEYALLKSDTLTFVGTPYAHAPNGTLESVSRLSPEAVQKWYSRFFSSANMTWVVVGDVNPLEVRKMIEGCVRGLAKGKPSKLPPVKKMKGAKSRVHQEKNKGQQTNLVLGFPAPHFNHKDYFAFRVLNTILSGMGGRLFSELREKNSLAYSVYASHEALEGAGICQVYVGCAPDKQKMAEQELTKVLVELARNPVSARELKRAQTYMIGLYQLGLQANRSQMSSLARYELSGPGAEVVAEFPKRVAGVTAEQIQVLAKKYLKLDEANWVVLAPDSKKD